MGEKSFRRPRGAVANFFSYTTLDNFVGKHVNHNVGSHHNFLRFSMLFTTNSICQKFRPRLHRNVSKWNRTSTVRIGLTFTWELMESFETEPLAVPERVHLESMSHMEPNQKVLV